MNYGPCHKLAKNVPLKNLNKNFLRPNLKTIKLVPCSGHCCQPFPIFVLKFGDKNGFREVGLTPPKKRKAVLDPLQWPYTCFDPHALNPLFGVDSKKFVFKS